MTTGFLDRRGGLVGRRAVVIGGGGGIGGAVSRGLAGAGVELAVCDIDGDALAETAEAARGLGVTMLAAEADATDTAALAAFYDRVAAVWDGFDILVNVVGGTRRGAFMASTPADWQSDIHRNYGYALESIHRAVPSLLRRGGGSIVNFTTIEAHRGAATFAVYAGAKAGLANFTRALGVELAPQGIRVNALASDSTPTQGNMNAISDALRAEATAVSAAQHLGGRRMYLPLGRAASVDDVANGVLFLVSDLAAAITGITLHVDAGTHAASGFVNWPNGLGPLPAPLGRTLEMLFPEAEDGPA